MKKLLVLALLAAACGGSPPPPPVTKIPMPAGAQLSPYAAPGQAHPVGIATLSGQAFVTLSNYDVLSNNFVTSGPGFVAKFPQGGAAVTAISLGGADGKQCENPGVIRAFGSNLYVACGSSSDGHGNAVVELDATGAVTRVASFSDIMPATLTATSNKIWVGDAFSASLRAVDRSTFAETGDHVDLACPTGASAGYNYVADLMIMNGDLWALCAADVGGRSQVTQRDANTGALKGTVDVGPLPTSIAAVGDGRIAVINSGDNTLTFVSGSGNALAMQPGVTFNSQTSVLQDVAALGGFLYTTASGSGTVQKIDPHAAGGVKIVSEVNVGKGSNPFDILPLDDTRALVTNLATNEVARVTW